MREYRIKLADSEAERRQVHALNYATFVEEIPQHHPPAGSTHLVDRFDAENSYVIATDAAGDVIAMLALRARRPFSLDQKLADLDRWLPPHRSPCEVRLLSVRREWRHGRVLRDLLLFAATHCIVAGHDLALISGTTRQLELYAHLGFEPFGPLVGAPDARFQPMYLSLESFLSRYGDALQGAGSGTCSKASFLTGPVPLHAGVAHAIAQAPVSHRGEAFGDCLRRVRGKLRALTGAKRVAVMVGSGTLANDVVAQSLAGGGEPGLVLANGEFGERLVDHARRAGLRFESLRRPWGDAFEPTEIEVAMRDSGARWLWAAHCETSTGTLNDLAMLREVAGDARLCLDAVSSFGTLPLDMDGVHLATCTSGKGAGAIPGLAVVLADDRACAPPVQVPRYLDLELWFQEGEVPFTQSSNLLAGLDVALGEAGSPGRLARIERDARWLRRELRGLGLRVVAQEPVASPGVTTVAVPPSVRSLDLARNLERRGFELGARSRYLVARNWLQVALMGGYDAAALRRLPAALAQAIAQFRRAGEVETV
jgi:aspartate aminotransferase-like enzyme